MNSLRKTFTLICFLLLMASANAQEYFAKDHGIIGDGKTLNTESIQNAIDLVHKKGGGQLIFEEGVYLSGSIVLRSNVELHLKDGSTLLGSDRISDYSQLKRWQALILAEDAENISIKGEGTIDGNGAVLALKIDSLFYAGEIDRSDYNFTF